MQRFLVSMIAGLALLPAALADGAPERAHQRPYLFFSREDVPGLRERLQREPFKDRWERFMAHAENLLTRGTPAPDRVVQNSRHSLGVAGTTAFAYVMTGEERYGERAIRELEALLEAPRWDNPRYGWNRGTDLDAAELSVAGALVYDWCYDLMTPEQRRRIRDGLLEKGIELYLISIGDRPDGWVHNPVSNWAGVCHGGGGLLGLAFYHESSRARRAADAAREHLQRHLREVVLEDGGGHEGVMYWRYGVSYGLYMAVAGARFHGDDEGLFQDLTDRLAGYWDIYMQGPDLRYANFNTMGPNVFAGLYGGPEHRFQGGPAAAVNAFFESQVPEGDQLLLWGADRGSDRFYWPSTSPFYFIWRRDVPPAGPRPELQDAVLFRGSGHAILRSPRLWLAYSGGWTSNRSHSERSLGSFVLVVDDERFVHNPGSGSGSGDTENHSTILVNGQGQPRDVRGRFLRFGQAEGYSYLASDLSECYPDTGLARFVRHVVMVRGEYLVILDDLAAESEAEFEWRLQSWRPAADRGERRVTLRAERNDLHVISASPPYMDVGVTPDHGPFEFTMITVGPDGPRPETTLVTVLFPTERGRAAPAARMDDDGVLRVSAADEEDVITFRRNDARWELHSVNGEDTSGIGTGQERTLVPFR